MTEDKKIQVKDILDRLEGFNDFVKCSMAEGHHENFPTVEAFIETSLEVFLDMLETKEES